MSSAALLLEMVYYLHNHHPLPPRAFRSFLLWPIFPQHLFPDGDTGEKESDVRHAALCTLLGHSLQPAQLCCARSTHTLARFLSRLTIIAA